MKAVRSNIDVLMDALDVAGRSIVDIGCGAGELAHRMGAAGAGAVLGIDPNPARIEKARAGAGANETFEVAGAEALPLEDGSVDIAVFFNSLHHIPPEAMDAAIAEARRALKPGGTLYVSEPVAGGSHFETMRPVNDETALRQAALDALQRAVDSGRIRAVCEEVNKITRFEKSFDTYCQRMIETDPRREALMREKEAEIRERFLSVARKTPAGYELDRLTRFNLYTKT